MTWQSPLVEQRRDVDVEHGLRDRVAGAGAVRPAGRDLDHAADFQRLRQARDIVAELLADRVEIRGAMLTVTGS